jgi:DNA (cytosine-5)-methyltransferase 1
MINPDLSVSDVFTISQAAVMLGVTAQTLRRWDRLGKFCASRHPTSNYRVYKRIDVERMRNLILGIFTDDQ